MKADYEYIGLRPRFSYFEHWRQYEHVHTLFWLGKDFAWNAQNPVMWVIFVIPTILVALDFIWETFRARDMMVDCVHYVAVLIWVMGNFTWAVGELFVSSHDDYPYSMWDTSEAARGQLRWWAAWVMFSAYIPIVLLYAVWLPLTYTGALDGRFPFIPLHIRICLRTHLWHILRSNVRILHTFLSSRRKLLQYLQQYVSIRVYRQGCKCTWAPRTPEPQSGHDLAHSSYGVRACGLH
jgi:hypothetical protein